MTNAKSTNTTNSTNKTKKKPEKKRRLNILRFSIFVFLLLMLIGAGAGFFYVYGIVSDLPEMDLTSYNPDLSAFVYDEKDELFAQLRGSEDRVWATYEELPEQLIDAFLAIEDVRYYEHFGVDVRSIGRAVLTNIQRGSYAQGSSTITMQLASNAFIGHRQKTMERKIHEAIIAMRLERMYTKSEILTLYLNHIYFGEGASGVKTASNTFFDKELDELTLAETALLAGLVQRPSSYSPYRNPEAATNRRNTVLTMMERYEFITAEEAEAAKNEEIVLNESRRQLQDNYPWFTDYVIKEASGILEELGMDAVQVYTAGLHIYTTMNIATQIKLEDIYHDPKYFPKSVDEVLVESAAVLLDHRTGEIKALVGGRELVTRRGLNRATDMKRQPGSTIKPIAAYGPALEAGYSPATVFDDAPIDFKDNNSVYSPHNFDRRWRGIVTMRTALKDSINIPALKALQLVGVNTGYEFAKKLGLPLTDQDANLSLALGGLTLGVSPLDMARSFGAFANQGVLVDSHVVRKIVDRDGKVIYEANPNKDVVMSEQTAYLMTDMLVSVIQSGTGTRANIGRPAAGKTGTTQLPPLPEFQNLRNHFRDAWFAGYTPEYTAVVWMGYDETTTKHFLNAVYGGHMPAAIWKEVMLEALKDQPAGQFERPQNLVYAEIDAKSGLLPSELTPSQYIVRELFARNNVPLEMSKAWVDMSICPESGLQANEFCPDPVMGVFLQRPVPYEPPPSRPGVYPEDHHLVSPAGVCEVHTEPSKVLVHFCEDERHRGVLHLAIPPSSGVTGGCPPDVVTERLMAPDEIPTQYCDIPEHQLSRPGQNEPPNNNNNGNSGNVPNESNINLSTEVIDDGTNIGVLLSWNGIGNDITYKIERKGNDDSKLDLGSTTGTTFLDESIERGATYRYQIIAGNRSSSMVSITIP